MNSKHALQIAGIAALLAGLLVVLGLAAWWLWSGHWVALSFIDALALLSPGTASSATVALSDIDVVYFVFAEAPLYGLLLAAGAVLLVAKRVVGVIANRSVGSGGQGT